MTGFANNLISAFSRRARVRPAPARLRRSTLHVESLEQRSLLTGITLVGAPLPDSPATDDVVVDGRIITAENFESANSSDQSIVRKLTGRTNFQPAGASAYGGGAGHDVIFGGLGSDGVVKRGSSGSHVGGVNVVFGDGSVRFVSDSIAGSHPFQSEYKYVPVRRMASPASGDAGTGFGGQIDYIGLEQASSDGRRLPFGGFNGGVYVATGDVNGDGRDDIIVGAGPGAFGGHVKVFDGASGAEIRNFSAFGGFSGGISVATGDVNGDGRDDVIVGAAGAPGGHVKVIDGDRLGHLGNDWLVGGTGRDNVSNTSEVGPAVATWYLKNSNSPGDPSSAGGGVVVAAGDLNGDGRDDIVIGANAAAGAHVKYFNGRFLTDHDLISAGVDMDVLISGTGGDENDDAASTDDNNHGTHVAGTVGAVGNNGPS